MPSAPFQAVAVQIHALAAATTGDREAARRDVTAAHDTATRWGWHAYVAWLDEARGRLDF